MCSCARISCKHIQADVFETSALHRPGNSFKRHLLRLSCFNTAVRMQYLSSGFGDFNLGCFLGRGEVVALQWKSTIDIKKTLKEYGYLFAPVSAFSTCYCCFDELHIDGHQIIDMYPGPGVGSFLSIEWCANIILDLIPKHREKDTLCSSRSLARSIDVWRGYDSGLYLFTVISTGFQNDLFGDSMKLSIRSRSNFVHVLDI